MMTGSFVHRTSIAGCSCSTGPPTIRPSQGTPMTNDHHPAATPRHTAMRWVWITLAIVSVCGLLLAAFLSSGDTSAEASRSEESPSTSSPTTTTLGLQGELVSRLREILARRERAYRERDPNILKDIYAVDCPCLKSDTNAIRELLREESVWIGGHSSIKVRRLERVSERVWFIVADFTSEPLRIETEGGRVVRNEPRGSELFQFVLVRPNESVQWLLGHASAYRSG
jgi:hypothetical protein